MPSSLFKSSPKLVELYLGDTALGSLDLQLLSGLDKLASLDLSHNELKALPPGVADPNFLKSLRSLDVSYNQLTFLANDTEPLLKRVLLVSCIRGRAFVLGFFLLPAALVVVLLRCFCLLCFGDLKKKSIY